MNVRGKGQSLGIKSSTPVLPIGIILFLFTGPFLTFPLRAQSTAEDVPTVEHAFNTVFAHRKTLSGENLQRLADAAYGSTLCWPFVWYFNRDTILDPERLPKGLTVKIPRLLAGMDDPVTARALDLAYQQIYGLYGTMGNRTPGQKQWVVLQASQAGVDPLSPSWQEILSPADKSWAKVKFKNLKKVVVGPQPVRVTESKVAFFGRSSERTNFLDAIESGAPLPQDELEAWVIAVENAGETDAVIAQLETLAANPDAPPQVHFALSLQYQRKGLIAKEYAALIRTKEAVLRRPDIVFNVVLLSGRTKLIERTVSEDTIMVGSLDVSVEPQGAQISVDGSPRGVGPLLINQLSLGAHHAEITLEGYETLQLNFNVELGRVYKSRPQLVGKPGIFVLSHPYAGLRYTLDANTENYSPGTEITLAPGLHTIQINEVNFDSYTKEISLERGQKLAFKPELSPVIHTWKFETVPSGAELTIDGTVIGQTPQTAVKLASGPHTIRIVKDKYAQMSKERFFYVQKPGVVNSSFVRLLTPRYFAPERSISIDGNLDDWDTPTILPRTKAPGIDLKPKIPGTNISQIRFAQDNDYLFVLFEFADGSPDFKTKYSINCNIYPSAKKYTEGVDLTIQGGSGLGYQLLINNGAQNRKDLLKSADTSEDFRIGSGLLEARFLKKVIAQRIDFQGEFKVDTGTFGPTGDWTGLNYLGIYLTDPYAEK